MDSVSTIQLPLVALTLPRTAINDVDTCTSKPRVRKWDYNKIHTAWSCPKEGQSMQMSDDVGGHGRQEEEEEASLARSADTEQCQADHQARIARQEKLPLQSGVSKNAQKKMLKAERLELLKPAKRQAERERRKARRREAKQAGLTVAPRSKLPPSGRKTVEAALVIDLGFDNLMTDKELASMTSQLSLLYSYNRLASHAFDKIHLCGAGEVDLHRSKEQDAEVAPPLLEGRFGRRMESVLQGCWRRWKDVVLWNAGGLTALYSCSHQIDASTVVENKIEKEKIIYLTADTESVLDTIQEDHAYVIGGIVDRNRHKNMCVNKANLLGLRTARLPISADRLKTSQVLTVNQVVQILLAFNEHGDWDTAFDLHLPRRKVRIEEERGNGDALSLHAAEQ